MDERRRFDEGKRLQKDMAVVRKKEEFSNNIRMRKENRQRSV